MRTDSVKKYVIPNIPYLFILWACLKLGTAYRLAPGADFAHKLMGLGQSIGPAFADFAPGLAPFDWLIGIVGAVGFRLLIYFKSKNAKKFRRDEEYGSARWGTEKDIKPFVDPKFENNVILTKTEFLIHEKSSLAPPGQSLAFSLGDEKGFEWIGAYDITADELLAGTDTAKTESKTAQAQMLILELLADGKRMPSAELEKTVNERGISSRTMRTAKSRIGDRLVTEKDGTAWVCYLRN